MAKTSPAKPARPKAKKPKTERMVRIPESYAVALEGLRDDDRRSLVDVVRLAVREFLQSRGKLPKVTGPA